MKRNSLAIWPAILPEEKLIARKSYHPKQGIIKLMAPPTPPDEKTIRELNALAARRPFCTQHRVKKHDTL